MLIIFSVVFSGSQDGEGSKYKSKIDVYVWVGYCSENNGNRDRISDTHRCDIKISKPHEICNIWPFFACKKGNFYSILIYPRVEYTNLENDIHTDF